MDEADHPQSAESRMYHYFKGQLETCYYQFRAYNACVPIWARTVEQIRDDPASIPFLRHLSAQKTSTWELLQNTQDTLVQQIQSLPPQERFDYTPAFIEIAEDIFGDPDQSRWPTCMTLTRHLRQWDLEKKVKAPRATQTTPTPTSEVPVASTGHPHHTPALPLPDGDEYMKDGGPPAKRRKINEEESESALPSIVVSPPAEHRAPVISPSDSPMVPTGQLPQWKLEPDSKENEAPRALKFYEMTAEQAKNKIEPDTEMTGAQTSSGRNDSLPTGEGKMQIDDLESDPEETESQTSSEPELNDLLHACEQQMQFD